MKIIKRLIVILLILLMTASALWYSSWYLGGDIDLNEISFAENEIGIQLDSQQVQLKDIKLHVVFAGPATGEPVILIHGFPQFWYMWRHHIKALAAAGYRVAAVDMRGYNRSDKPTDQAAYSYEKYAGDITGLMDTQGWSNANIVSHDIGAIVAWELVFDNPERVKRAVIFSGVHPLAAAKATEVSDVSWYRTFFRLPFLPELISHLGGLTLTANGLRDTSRAGTFTEKEFKIYRAAWQRDHAYYSMLGSYRNGGIDAEAMPDNGTPSMPVLYVNGLQDKFVPRVVALDIKNYLGEENVSLHENLSHWLLEEEPEMTAQEIISFLQSPVAVPH